MILIKTNLSKYLFITQSLFICFFLLASFQANEITKGDSSRYDLDKLISFKSDTVIIVMKNWIGTPIIKQYDSLVYFMADSNKTFVYIHSYKNSSSKKEECIDTVLKINPMIKQNTNNYLIDIIEKRNMNTYPVIASSQTSYTLTYHQISLCNKSKSCTSIVDSLLYYSIQ